MGSWSDYAPPTPRPSASIPKQVAYLLVTSVSAALVTISVIVMVAVLSGLNVIPESETKSAVNRIGLALLNENHFLVTGTVMAGAWFVGSAIRSRRRATT